MEQNAYCAQGNENYAETLVKVLSSALIGLLPKKVYFCLGKYPISEMRGPFAKLQPCRVCFFFVETSKAETLKQVNNKMFLETAKHFAKTKNIWRTVSLTEEFYLLCENKTNDTYQ